jgi:hypothetical protein
MEFYARAWIFELELAPVAFVELIALFVLVAFGLRRLRHWIRLSDLSP